MKIKLILLGIVVLAALLHLVKLNSLPVCMNADEAAFGYNAYSILKTGKDEYGMLLPLRLKSFGDYKLPLYSYLSIPFIGAMGLTELSTRTLAILIGILFPLAAYFLTKELFEDERIAILTAFLSAVSPWIQILARSAHEAPLAAFLLVISAIFLLKFIKSNDKRYLFMFSLFELLSLFAYHLSRPIVLAMLIYLGYQLFQTRKYRDSSSSAHIGTRGFRMTSLMIAIIPLLLFSITDVIYNPARVKNLLFLNDGGFNETIRQKLVEKNWPLIYNQFTETLIQIPKEYSKYFSPEFLVNHGDVNNRFNHIGISPITLVEYAMVFIGLYFLLKHKPKHTDFLILLLLVAPIAASLTLFEYSQTRSFFLVVPLLILASYGLVNLLKETPKKYYRASIAIVALIFFFYNFMSWDFYFFHYPYKAVSIRSWQCGYKELAQYVGDNYSKFDRFNITTRNGEPYIFMLFYSRYDPASYQKQAKLSPPDEYGFGQVWEFDKFDFQLNMDRVTPKTSYIGFPEHFKNQKNIDQSKIKKIINGTEEIFWIYEN